MNSDLAATWRSAVPATDSWVWLDTPGSPPALRPVAAALSDAVSCWLDGDFDWAEWDARPQRVRELLARWLEIEPGRISLMTSAAEAAATVAASTHGTVVVPETDFRSTLLPWIEPHEPDRTKMVPSRDGVIHTTDVINAIDPSTTLVAVSELLSSTGARVDIGQIAARTHEVGARLFVDATQSMGVLDCRDLVNVADYVAVHGYKWMMCPRGAAWLIHGDGSELRPLSPGWRSGPPPHSYFGGTLHRTGHGADLDSSPAWLSWIGAEEAIGTFLRSDPAVVEPWALSLAARFRQGLTEIGLTPVDGDLPSPIVVAAVENEQGMRESLTRHRVKASVFAGNLRVGFHVFNNHHDVEAALSAVASATAA